MTYQELIRRTAANLSITSISSAFIATAKRDMYDVVNSITRKIQFLKEVKESTITDASGDLTLETDFFFPVEVVFLNESGHQFISVEIQRESYEKWIPNVSLITTSFVELVTSATPDVYIWTRENEDFDGKIGYLFTDTSPRVLKWKPLVDGSVKVIYAKYDENAITTLSSSPEMHKTFHELIVLGLTLKLLYRMLLSVESEVKLIAIDKSIRLYQKEFKDMIGDFTAFAEKKSTFEVQRMEGFEFLNDRNMLL